MLEVGDNDINGREGETLEPIYEVIDSRAVKLYDAYQRGESMLSMQGKKDQAGEALGPAESGTSL